jgi:hypothetical protein
VSLPEEELAKLRALQAEMTGYGVDSAPVGFRPPRFGDVFHFYAGEIRYGSSEERRFAVCVHEEGDPPILIHFVVGSRKDRSGPKIVLEAHEAGVWEKTHFKFFRTYGFAPAEVAERADYAGHVSEMRKREILQAIKQSTLPIKRLVP